MDEKSMNIQWYPGHMTKTRRIMEEDLKLVDAVCEILDARIPISSRNPDIDTICGSKPRMIILNRIDMADPAMVARWSEYFKRKGWAVIQTDCKSRKGINQFAPAVRTLLAEKLARYAEKGQVGRPLKLMVVGIPNVGKSTFINQIAGRKGAKAENRPGVTRGKQWVTVDQGLLLLDTPGILWPKFEDPQVGMRLAYTGAVKDDEDDDEDEDDEDYEDDFGDEDEFDFGDETLYEVKCPTCGEVITIDEEMLDEGSTKCPNCGEELEFDMDEDEGSDDE